MFGLIPNIARGRIDSGNADAKRAVPLLPFKRRHFRKCFVNPFRRIAFEELQRFGHRERRRQ